ncbi:hypothetical protein GCM10023143_26610 [Compostibacter hankyongensis]|uniref:Uncharacterized protein n=2 Tax=Compostibacter hankyongensis TaxID=1007089 RepID=A0ABP8G1V2_9BACT
MIVVLGGLLSAFSSCKKEDIKVSGKEAEGTFTAFEITMDGKTTPMPTEDESMKIKVTVVDATKAEVILSLTTKDKTDQTPPISCSIKKDPDGFTYLTDIETGKELVLYYDKNTIDCFVPDGKGTTVSASRNGKKPDWWDD